VTSVVELTASPLHDAIWIQFYSSCEAQVFKRILHLGAARIWCQSVRKGGEKLAEGNKHPNQILPVPSPPQPPSRSQKESETSIEIHKIKRKRRETIRFLRVPIRTSVQTMTSVPQTRRRRRRRRGSCIPNYSKYIRNNHIRSKSVLFIVSVSYCFSCSFNLQ